MSALRAVTWRDIPQLAALETELFADDAWTVETWWAELAGRPRRAYLRPRRGAAASRGMRGWTTAGTSPT